ncbi:hypothetical protein ACB098_12G130700 [Castanea mollissima]
MSGMRFSNLLLLTLVVLLGTKGNLCEARSTGFAYVTTNGTRFVLKGNSVYLNGFNAYWLMYMASFPANRDNITATFQLAAKSKMNVLRTWAFSDGVERALQTSPGVYNEEMFEGLDFVISESRKYGLPLILSLVNNFADFGGRKQYVQWARESGQTLKNDDDFYTNTVVKQYYKNHVKAILTRANSIIGIPYKDDPMIFAWELINEPRCETDPSGRFVQEWVREMAAFVKSIDSNHLLEIGLEGFYGDSIPPRREFNPGNVLVGTDFISNNQLPGVDFATIHLYPEQWLPNLNDSVQAAFVDKWIEAHIEDSQSVLQKPLVLAEFGKSSKLPGYTQDQRDNYFAKLYEEIYNSSSNKGPLVGGIFWQVLAQGMDSFRDGYEVLLEESPSTTSVIAAQSSRLLALNYYISLDIKLPKS